MQQNYYNFSNDSWELRIEHSTSDINVFEFQIINFFSKKIGFLGDRVFIPTEHSWTVAVRQLMLQIFPPHFRFYFFHLIPQDMNYFYYFLLFIQCVLYLRKKLHFVYQLHINLFNLFRSKLLYWLWSNFSCPLYMRELCMVNCNLIDCLRFHHNLVCWFSVPLSAFWQWKSWQ